MKRLDICLVELGLAPSRTKAQELIELGQVEIKVGDFIKDNSSWTVSRQSSQKVVCKIERIRLVPSGVEVLRYVSRAGLKLEGALKDLDFNVQGFCCLDIGQSTGGFTDCLLQRGATKVCGIDVGHGQLHEKMKLDARVTAFEGVHVKDIADHAGVKAWLLGTSGQIDLVVVDVSFISLLNVLPYVVALAPRILALVKPQFEVGREFLDKKGIADSSQFDHVKGQILNEFIKYGFAKNKYFQSQIKGQDGNQEFFIFSERA